MAQLEIFISRTDLLVEFIGPTDDAGAPTLEIYTMAGRRIASWSIGGTNNVQKISRRLLPSETFIVRGTMPSGMVYTKSVSSVR